ncbi:MAG TPA: hypothetical protein VFS22_06025 [Flavisolibacter sp.]|nr:hypothetical protein [Flavisolibacter sp.]
MAATEYSAPVYPGAFLSFEWMRSFAVCTVQPYAGGAPASRQRSVTYRARFTPFSLIVEADGISSKEFFDSRGR